MDLEKEFLTLFTGLDRAHGQFILTGKVKEGKKIKGRAKTVLTGPNESHWKSHLDGDVGLGVIPIMSDNRCMWGAIDIDVYDLDIEKLDRVICKHKIPAVVCRTKSGGAHLYFFMTSPIPAGDIREKLIELAGILGFPGVEIFPKQIKLANDKDVGNWINMPYFDHANTLRYALENAKAITAHEFVALAHERAVTPDELTDFEIKDAGDLSDGPPCLQHYCKVGFPEGTKNHALFSMGVYAKLRYGDHWEEWVDKYNYKYMGPGKSSEVQNIIKSLRKKDYFYKCKDQPLQAACNKHLCSRRKFGIGSDDADIPYVLGTLVKIDSDPPLWFIDVDGHRLQLKTEDLIDQGRFRKLCVEKIHKFPKQMKKMHWEDIIAERLENLEVVEAPQDAGVNGQFVQLVEKFFSRPPGETKEALLMGKHYVEEGRVMFRSNELMSFLDRERFRDLKAQDVWASLRAMGAKHGQMGIKGKNVQYWSLPEPDNQKKKFTLPDEKGTSF